MPPRPSAVLGRLAALVLAVFYGTIRLRHRDYWDLLDDVNLAIHEAGHLFFQAFSDPWHTFGGSLFQVIVPVAFAGYFIKSRQFLSVAVTLVWVAVSLVNVALYVGDAQAQELPLLGGENTVHDWWFLLTEWDLLKRDREIASVLRNSGAVLLAVSLGVGLATLRESSAGPHPKRTT
jgi:hypothetical protein